MDKKRTLNIWVIARVTAVAAACVMVIMGMLLPLYNVMISGIKLAEGESLLSMVDIGTRIFMVSLPVAAVIAGIFSKGLFLLCNSVVLTVEPMVILLYELPLPAEYDLGVGFYLLIAGWCGFALSLFLCIPSGEKKEKAMNKESVRAFRSGAGQGNSEAQFNLGVMYSKGDGVKQDYKKAAEYFQMAAAQGNCKAQNNLGWMYANGKGVEKDDEMAVQYYHLAAEQGFGAAQYNLGVRYETGKGVEKNTGMAMKYYLLAAEQGHNAAKTAVERIKGTKALD